MAEPAAIGYHRPLTEKGPRTMKTRAAIGWKAGQPLEVITLDLAGPKTGEVLVEIKASGVCHTDEFTRSGGDPEGLFPVIFGHEGAGIVVDVGPGVTTLKKGDHVIPLYTPECRQCKSCTSHKTNLCTAIRATQGQGVMPDGTSRFSIGNEKVHHYMGCSTFSNYTVLPEIALAKVREDAPFEKICYIGCGVTTGIGAVINTAKVEPGANVVVFGLGGIGLNVIQGARMAGANKIIGVDINPKRKAMAEKFGMTHFVNPKEVQGDLVPYLVSLTDGGADYSLRVRRPRRSHAPGARVLPSRLGRVGDHRRRRRRPGNQDAAVPAGHRPRVERHGLRRRARPHRRAEDRRLVHGQEDQHRRPHHARDAARQDQRRFRSHAQGRIHSLRSHFLNTNNDEGMLMAVKLHPSIDKGLKAGAKKFKGGTLTCHCAADPVTVTIKGNVAHNHACGCTKCWKPAGAKFSVVAVVRRDNLSVTANEQKLHVVDASATIQRHACSGCGVHMYGRIENTEPSVLRPRLRARGVVEGQGLGQA